MRRKRTGFTLVELLAALGIIALMVGLLIPALSMVRRTAKEVKQKAQFATIDMALLAFKNDYGDYPPSNNKLGTGTYCGAQTLAEALLGWDLRGFHPKSAWWSHGMDAPPPDGKPVYLDTNLHQRKGPYLELATVNVFRLGQIIEHDGLFRGSVDRGLFNRTSFISNHLLDPDRFVICDAFGAKKVTLANSETVRAGAPILYYRANTSAKTLDYSKFTYNDLTYNVYDNHNLVRLRRLADWDKLWDYQMRHKLEDIGAFYGYITDPKASTPTFSWPYRPDSYILISAGVDGLYGTSDDIRNFGN